MTSKAFRERLARRAKSAGVSVGPDVVEALETYLKLLTRWNAKVNLTALRLDEPTDETFDRLLLEPLAAARIVEDSWSPWMDIGSGGGSPAIPLKLVKPALQLTLVESKARKAAFLREAVRELGLESAAVENRRFEELAERPSVGRAVGLLTARAVRFDSKLIKSITRVLRPSGHLLAFKTSPDGEELDGFRIATALQISRDRPSYLLSYQRSGT